MKKFAVNLLCAFIPSRRLRRNIRAFVIGGGGGVNYTIGKYSYCGAILVAPKTKIGKYCSIAAGVSIHPPEHGINKVSVSPNIPGHIETAFDHASKNGAIIGNDVWIGMNAIILQSCASIGHGAVIAAGAIVTKPVPPYAVVGGVPAKIIKFRFPKTVCQALLESKWWDLPDDVLSKFPMNDVSEFLKRIKHDIQNCQ